MLIYLLKQCVKYIIKQINKLTTTGVWENNVLMSFLTIFKLLCLHITLEYNNCKSYSSIFD